MIDYIIAASMGTLAFLVGWAAVRSLRASAAAREFYEGVLVEWLRERADAISREGQE